MYTKLYECTELIKEYINLIIITKLVKVQTDS